MVSRNKRLWTPAPKELVRRACITSVFGDSDTGRTTFGLSGPAPIAYISTAEKWDGIIQKVADEKEVQACLLSGDFPGTTAQIKKKAEEQMARLEEAYYDAWNWARTILLDNGTQVWRYCQLAEWGTQTPRNKSGALAWQPVTNRFMNLITHAREQQEQGSRCNLMIIGETKDEYKGKPPKSIRTGRTIRKEQSDVTRLCDVVIRTKRDEGNSSVRFYSTLRKGWMSSNLVGEELEGDESTFPYWMMVITDTDESEWS